MAMITPEKSTLPHRSTGGIGSDEDAVPDTDPSDVGYLSHVVITDAGLTQSQTSSILLERLQAYKHAVGYLEDYISATEKVEKAHAKEYEKVLKVQYSSSFQRILLTP